MAEAPTRGPLRLLRMWVDQQRIERRLENRGTTFRSTDADHVQRAYESLSPGDFERVNGPQCWLNEHTIPVIARVQTAQRPWRIADLGCGSGGSSQLLLEQAPAGSTLIGYDLCGPLLEQARARSFRDSADARAQVNFVQQSIAEPLCDPDGAQLPDASIDVAHAAGVVGHHLDEAQVKALAREMGRVLAPDGVAILDAGPRMRARRLIRTMKAAGFVVAARHRLHWLASRVALAFRRRR